MKLEDLFDEQSSKPVSKGTRPPTQTPTQTQTMRTPSRKDTPAPPRKPLASRAEVLEAILLLSGGNAKVSSIVGGKKKKGKR